MVEQSKLIKVRNRDNGTVGYTIPDLGNLHRNFQPGEEKTISMEELTKLSYLPGGDIILREYLIIEDKDALAELLSDIEPEYFYTKDEIKKLLSSGTINEFLDALDFAPEGVIELIKSLSVEMELNDVAKRDAILKKTGFNVTKAIEINKETSENKNDEGKIRRVEIEKKEESQEKTRRVDNNNSKYNVVSRGN